MHPRYLEWLDHVFNHPVGEDDRHRSSEICFEDDESTVALLLQETFTRSGKDLSSFSDAQVNEGIYYLAHPAEGDFVAVLTSAHVPLDLRVQGIRAIETLYRDCFAKRCTRTLSHLDQKGASLNQICYMFWDLNSLSYITNVPDQGAVGGAILGVLDSILTLDHLACQEAALHGLGHLFNDEPERVMSIVDGFLQTEILNDRLRDYALGAREGLVQ